MGGPSRRRPATLEGLIRGPTQEANNNTRRTRGQLSPARRRRGQATLESSSASWTHLRPCQGGPRLSKPGAVRHGWPSRPSTSVDGSAGLSAYGRRYGPMRHLPPPAEPQPFPNMVENLKSSRRGATACTITLCYKGRLCWLRALSFFIFCLPTCVWGWGHDASDCSSLAAEVRPMPMPRWMAISSPAARFIRSHHLELYRVPARVRGTTAIPLPRLIYCPSWNQEGPGGP